MRPSQVSGTLPGMRWNGWRELRGRDHIHLFFGVLPDECGGALYVPDGELAAIKLDTRLTQAERHCALTHELVHDERGGGCDLPGMPTSWGPVVTREERIVDDTAVQRLVPHDELLRHCVELEIACTHVEPHHIADHFHVTEAVARRALELQDLRIRAALDRHYQRLAEEAEGDAA